MKYVALIVIALLLIPFLKSETEAQSSELPVINASILYIPYYYIVISDKLWEGIFFTNETGAAQNIQYPLISGSFNNSAVWNYNKSSGKTEYWIYFDGNVKGNICHGAATNLCSRPGCTGLDNKEINISNAKWSASTTNDLNNPSLGNAIPFKIGFDDSNRVFTNITAGSFVYLRYWLDIPAGSPAAAYNTTYQIRVVMAGESCV